MEIFVIVVGIFGLLIVIAVTLSVVRMIIRRTPEVKPQPLPMPQPIPTPQPRTPALTPAPTMQPPASFLPTLPGTCANCQGPINMKEVTWTGPMSAACPYCGSSIDIKWNKLGD